MIEQIIFKGNELAVNSTPNTYTTTANGSAYAAPQAGAGAAKMVLRIVNNNNTNVAIITLANTTFSANMTLLANSVIFVQKLLTDTIACPSQNGTGNPVQLGIVGYTY